MQMHPTVVVPPAAPEVPIPGPAPIEEIDAAARRRATEMEAAIDAFPVGAMIVEADGAIRTMNGPARDLFDAGEGPARWLLASEWLRSTAVEWPDGRPVEHEETPFARAMRGEVVRDVLVTFRPRGGARRWIQVSAVPLGNPGAIHAAVLAFVDVTGAREIETEREAFLTHVSQEMAQRLRAIVSRAERIRDEPGAGTARAHAAEILQAARLATSHLADLQRRLHPRSLAANPEMVDVKALLLDVLERLAAEVDVARVSVSAAPGLRRAHADPDQLEQILVALLVDALSPVSAGSEVAVSCTAPDGHLRIRVSSSGREVDATDLPRLFDRFFRTPASPSGRLHVVRCLAEANRGRVRAQIDPAGRLAVDVELPLRPG